MPYTFLCCNPRISKIELNLAGIAHKPDKIQHFHTCRPHTPIGLQRQLRGGPPAIQPLDLHLIIIKNLGSPTTTNQPKPQLN